MQRYSGALTREQFMLREMRSVAGLRQAGLSDEEILEKVCAENLFQYPTEKEIRRKGRQCLKRVGFLADMPGILRAMAEGQADEAALAALIGMMGCSRVMAEFMETVVAEKYRTLDYSLGARDVNLFFMRLSEQDEGVAGWSAATVNKIRQVILHALREAGVLSQKGELLPVCLPDEFRRELKQAGHGAFLPALNEWE